MDGLQGVGLGWIFAAYASHMHVNSLMSSAMPAGLTAYIIN